MADNKFKDFDSVKRYLSGAPEEKEGSRKHKKSPPIRASKGKVSLLASLVKKFSRDAYAAIKATNVTGNARQLAYLALEIHQQQNGLSAKERRAFHSVRDELGKNPSFTRHWQLVSGKPLKPFPQEVWDGGKPSQPAGTLKPLPKISISAVFRAVNELCNWKVPLELSLPRPAQEDLDLALGWARGRVEDLDLALGWARGRVSEPLPEALDIDEAKENYGKHWDLTKMVAARCGELAAREFYENIGCTVEDIAIGQTRRDSSLSSSGNEWTKMDLRVDGRPVDVKNARRGRASPDRYVEHLVPRFKKADGTDVLICGVLSEFQWLEKILSKTSSYVSGRALILGETSRDKHRWLEETYRDPEYLELDLEYLEWDLNSPRARSTAFLPGWVYDLPPRLETKRQDYLKTIGDKMIRAGKDLHWTNNRFLPIALAVNHLPEAAFRGADPWVQRFMLKLRKHLSDGQGSLPIIFLSVLTDALRVVGGYEERPGFEPSQYKSLLRLRPRDESWPAGTYDPLKMVAGLIDSLELLWPEMGHARRFRRFRLQSFNILQGRESRDEGWWTLLAYCGGRENKGKGVKCGKNPLVVGREQWCDNDRCRHLVCPNCRHCSDICENNYASK